MKHLARRLPHRAPEFGPRAAVQPKPRRDLDILVPASRYRAGQPRHRHDAG